jgi:hypothetical protein
MPFKLDEQGRLVDDAGTPIKVGDTEIRLDGYLPQSKVDEVVKERLARDREKLTNQIKALEAQAQRGPELESLLKQAKADLERVEGELKTAKDNAAAEVAGQMEKLKRERDQAIKDAEDARAAHLREQLTTQILGAAGDSWINPVHDLVPRLLATHKREPKTQNGQPVKGEFVDLFVVKYRDEKGNTVEEALPVVDAISKMMAAPENAHYLKPGGRGGSGGPGGGSQKTDGKSEGFTYPSMMK